MNRNKDDKWVETDPDYIIQEEAAAQHAAKHAANKQAQQNAIKKICLSGLCSYDNLPFNDSNHPLWEELKIAGDLTSAELVALKVLKLTYNWWNIFQHNSV